MTFGALFLRAFGALLLLTAMAVALSRAPDRPPETLVARWAPPPSDFVAVGDQVVHLRDVGPRSDPAPLVLLHGTASSLHTWQAWTTALQTERRVISLDMRGFGLTGPSAEGRYGPEDDAQFIWTVLDTLGVQQAVLAGNSLGGEVAWRMALQQPARARGLVLVDSAGYGIVGSQLPAGFAILRVPVLRNLAKWLLPRSLIALTLRQIVAPGFVVSDEMIDRHFELLLREGNREALLARAAAYPFGRDSARIAELRLPTLVMWGQEDKFLPVENAQRFMRDIPGAQLALLPGVGHLPQEEAPAASVQALREFLKERGL